MVEQLSGQLSIWDILTEDQLPAAAEDPAPRLIAPEDFHVGVRGWMIHAVLFREEPDWKYYGTGKENDSPIRFLLVYTDRWKSVKEPWQDSKGRWGTSGEKVLRKGDRYSGWYGGFRPLYHQTPTFDERIEAAHKSRDYQPGVRIVDADHIVALEGPPLTDDDKDFLRRLNLS